MFQRDVFVSQKEALKKRQVRRMRLLRNKVLRMAKEIRKVGKAEAEQQIRGASNGKGGATDVSKCSGTVIICNRND